MARGSAREPIGGGDPPSVNVKITRLDQMPAHCSGDHIDRSASVMRKVGALVS
jgi:hypothetical protein